jgi:hypothetical protein
VPEVFKPLLDPVMGAFFRSPEEAMDPVLYLALAPDIAGDTGWYLHLMKRKLPSPAAPTPPTAGLWEQAEARLARWLG